MVTVPLSDSMSQSTPTPFGKPMLKHFLFDPEYKNLNHGSYGTYPRAVNDKRRQLLDLCESAPDAYIRFNYSHLLDESRLAISKVVNAPVETLVLVPNATMAMNTVLRNFIWNEDRKDEILYLSTIYGSCGKTVQYMEEYSASKVTGRSVPVTYPIEDDEMVQLLKDAISKSRKEGKRPRIAIFDTISSIPGVRVPFEALTALCRGEGVLSLIDGAHGAGNIKLDLSELNPDFFLTNLHKWLFVPRGCCLLYVPVKHQAMIRSTLPTGHGFEPLPDESAPLGPPKANPYVPKKLGDAQSKSHFIEMFDFVGTIDDSPYLCIPSALQFRREICGGEEAILSYNHSLAKSAATLLASMLKTSVLDNSTNTITNCCMFNVRMPLTTDPNELKEHPSWWLVKEEEANDVSLWISQKTLSEFKTYVPVYPFQGGWWARFSAQVYLDIGDFEWAGGMLKDLCERVGKGGFVDT